MTVLKHAACVLLALGSHFYLSAQTTASADTVSKNNILKLNLSALLFKNISVQYERKVSRKSTVALNVHVMPFGNIPFKSAVEKAIDDASVDLDKLKVGNMGVTAEYRFYIGKKGAMRGFYLGPFLSYNNYKADLPLNYSNDTRTGVFSGKLKTYTAGLQLGAQWQLSKTVYLDWWILGPNYGSASGDLILNTALSPSEQQDLRDEIENLKNDVPLKTIKSYEVNASGAKIVAKGPWGGLRGLGINIGFRF